MFFCRWLYLLILLPFLVNGTQRVVPLNIAVASNFAPTMKKIVAQYTQQTGSEVNVLVASSGKHYLQILYGAPIDLFFSADQVRPASLVKNGKAMVRSTYAIGQLVYWLPTYDGEKIPFDTAIRLPVQRISLANPKHAPYGKASQQVLEKWSLWGRAAPHAEYVFGENVAQSYLFIQSKSVSAGFVAYAQIKQNTNRLAHQYWLVPNSDYQPIKQDVVVINKRQESAEFMTFFRSDAVQALIASDGYVLP